MRDVWKISSGFGVELLLTSNEQLIRSGDFQQVEYEQVCLRKRKQKLSRAHGSLQNFKLLPQRDASMILEANDRTSCVPIGLPTGHRVRQIACGLSHCAVITESESSMLSLFTMGHGLYGQLGLGETVHAPSLTPVTSSSELLLEMLAIGSHDGVTLRCGPFATSLLIRDTSSVWLWGLLPCADSPTKLSVQDTPTLFPWINPGVRVADVAMGMEHLTLLSTSGSVFTWGIGCSGQLGLELTARENAHQNAARVQFYDANVVVESISSGWYHTMAVATDGRVFAWGCNRYGACGATTKFLEYFHPVLLTLPSNLIQDPSSKWSVHCWGHTSSLLVKHRSGAIERTLVWGICSSKHASLLPVDAGGSASGHQDFVHAQAGFGCIHWIVQQRQQVSKVPIPLFQLIADHSSPIVNGDRTFYCDSDETVTLPLTMVPGFEANDAAVHDAVIISLRAVSRHRRLSQAASLNAQCRLCENTSQGAGLVIKMDPMEEGEYCIQVAINGLFVLGFPVCLKVSAKSSNIVDNIGHDQCEILGISVTSQSASEEESSLANLRWFGTKFHRVRVTTQDELVILARVSTNCSLDLKCHGNDNHSRTIPLIALTSDSCGTQFALAVVTFPIPASFAVGIVSSDPPNDPRNVLYVDCCAAERELKSVVSAHKRLVGRYLASVSTMESPVYAKFALFMSSILNHGTLRLVTARSPWIDVDSEPLFDFDRFAFEQQILKASKDPFILWKSILDSDLDTDIVHEKAVREGRTLDELMPTWSTEIRHACYAPLKALVNGGVQKSIALPDTRDASEHQTTSRRVHQSPYEFLIRTSSTMSIGQNGDQCDDAICSWLDHNGDVHYTPKRHDGQYLIAVYLNDNGGALVEGNPVALWKRQLHAVLWPLIDTHDTSMTGLFRFLAACNGDTESTITYQSFVRRTQALGFGRSMAKQQWYALFVNIQAMSLTERPTIPLHVFRSFLVDPFHEVTHMAAVTNLAYLCTVVHLTCICVANRSFGSSIFTT